MSMTRITTQVLLWVNKMMEHSGPDQWIRPISA